MPKLIVLVSWWLAIKEDKILTRSICRQCQHQEDWLVVFLELLIVNDIIDCLCLSILDINQRFELLNNICSQKNTQKKSKIQQASNQLLPKKLNKYYHSINVPPFLLSKQELAISAKSKINWSINAIKILLPLPAKKNSVLIVFSSSSKITLLIIYKKMIRGNVLTFERFVVAKTVVWLVKNLLLYLKSTLTTQFTAISEAK